MLKLTVIVEDEQRWVELFEELQQLKKIRGKYLKYEKSREGVYEEMLHRAYHLLVECSTEAVTVPDEKHIRRVLELSTAHLTPEMRAELTECDNDNRETNTPSLGGAIFYPLTYGALMWVPDSPDESNEAEVEEKVPQVLLRIQLYARALRCDYVLFDADAEVCDRLESFDE